MRGGGLLCVEFTVNRTSPTLSRTVVDGKVVQLQPKTNATSRANYLTTADENTLPALMKRASEAGRQMKYFGLVAQKSSFDELLPSARRAGFNSLHVDLRRREAAFQWSAEEPDFIFNVSFNEVSKVSVVAQSCGDIFGLILTSYSHARGVSVETDPSLVNRELGCNALLFRDILLMFPDFDTEPAWTKYL
jgi:hypothetical protein